MKSFIAGKNESDVRLSRFVESVTTGLPKGLMYKAFRNKRIKVNGKKEAADYRLNENDLIELYINDEFFTEKKDCTANSVKKRSKKLEIKIIYEDDNIAVLYKPAHMLCHSDRTGDPNLVDLFTEHLLSTGEYDPSLEISFKPALCNRLDRGTEGLVIAAKNHIALRDMNQIIKSDLLIKKYYTITYGVPPKGIHKAYLKHFEKDNKVNVKAEETAGYKQILTEVNIDKVHGPFALCKIGLITGRTHQIRAHLSFLKTPVLGDIKYGNRKINESTGFKTQALCAAEIDFKSIPPENILHYLSGRIITLKSPRIIEQFEKL